MAEESSFTRRALTGIAMGAAATAGMSRIDATPGQRVAVPAAFGAFLILLLPDEADVGASIILGAAAASGALSSAVGESPWAFLPEDLRPDNVSRAVRERRTARRGRTP